VELELSKGARERLKELRSLSEAAKGGDKKARRELRKAVRVSSPEVVTEAADVARLGQLMVIRSLSGDNALRAEALEAKLDLMRVELLDESPLKEGPSALEAILVERIVSAWIVGEFFEAILCGQLQTGLGRGQRGSPSYLKFLLGWQEQAHRRLLSAIRALTTTRRLLSGIPNSQTNVQVNVGTWGAERVRREARQGGAE
jgi:sRNA-binding protein